MKILVTGGAGYIGSHAVYALIEQGHEVAVVDNLVTGHRQDVHPKAKFFHGDIGNYRFMRDVLTTVLPDGVIHFAAYSLVGESMANPFKYYENNVGATNSMLKAMSDAGISNIVFSSTAATYGDVLEMPITEAAPTNPTNAYGETKLAMERMMDWNRVAHGLNYVSLRYFNVAGAHPSGAIGEKHDPETHLIPLILEVAAGKREYISVFGDDYPTPDGTCIRDYIHVMDLAEAHILAMKYLLDGNPSTTCNLGNGEGFSVLEAIEAARLVTGKPIPIKISPRRAGDPARLIASSERAQSLLGWIPKQPQINDILKSAWKIQKF
ncbi:MAG: UDP-glucose 4-epimerase GalE [Turicibacter sp.]|nr:UDP-glucose 4-epimerase GalE [Turicibacter sp.]